VFNTEYLIVFVFIVAGYNQILLIINAAMNFLCYFMLPFKNMITVKPDILAAIKIYEFVKGLALVAVYFDVLQYWK
jgi:hypothetical protein